MLIKKNISHHKIEHNNQKVSVQVTADASVEKNTIASLLDNPHIRSDVAQVLDTFARNQISGTYQHLILDHIAINLVNGEAKIVAEGSSKIGDVSSYHNKNFMDVGIQGSFSTSSASFIQSILGVEILSKK